MMPSALPARSAFESTDLAEPYYRNRGRPAPTKQRPSTIRQPPTLSSSACWRGRFGAMPASVHPETRQIKLKMITEISTRIVNGY